MSYIPASSTYILLQMFLEIVHSFFLDRKDKNKNSHFCALKSACLSDKSHEETSLSD